MARIGELWVELFVARDGRVEGIVSESERSQLTSGVTLTVTLAAADQPPQRIPLRFDAAQQRFLGQSRGGVTLESGRAQVELSVNDVARVGELLVVANEPPALGGYLLAAEDTSVEVVAKASGELLARAHDAAGVALTGDAAQLGVTLRGVDAKRVSATLHWDAERGLFTALAPAPLSFGWLELEVRRGERSSRGRRAEIALLPEAAHGGRLLAAGLYSTELVTRKQQLCAYVYNAFGKPYPAPHLQLMVALGPPQRYRVSQLVWDAAAAGYCSVLAAKGVSARDALRVSLSAGARTFFGAARALSP